MKRRADFPRSKVNGYSMKARSLWFAIFVLLAIAASAQTADEIVNKSLAARGGAEKIKAIQSERVSGRVTFGPGLEGTLVAELKRPHKLRVEIVVEDQKIIRVYDGKSAGWVAHECGFADQSHLNRRFKECHGLTPGAFQAQYRAKTALVDAAAA